MVTQIHPAVVNRFECFFRRGLHAPQATEDCPYLTHVQTSQGRFNPLQGLYRMAILRFGHLMEVLCTVVVVEHLTRLGEQRLDVLPYPLGAIANHTKPHGLLGNHAGVFHLLQGLAHLMFRLYLMPTEYMHDALAIEQVEAQPLGFAPFVVPSCPSCPLARLPRAAPPSARRPRRHIGPINPQDQHRTAKTACCDLGNTPLNLLARRRHLQHTEALRHPLDQRVHALTTDRDATKTAKQRRGRLVRELGCQVHRCLLHVKVHPTRTQAQHLVERITAALALATIEIRPLKLDGTHEGLDGATYRRACLQQTLTCRTVQRGATVFCLMAVLNNRLCYACGERLAQAPDRLAHLV